MRKRTLIQRLEPPLVLEKQKGYVVRTLPGYARAEPAGTPVLRAHRVGRSMIGSDELYRGKIVTDPPWVTGQQRHVGYGGMGADIEVG